MEDKHPLHKELEEFVTKTNELKVALNNQIKDIITKHNKNIEVDNMIDINSDEFDSLPSERKVGIAKKILDTLWDKLDEEDMNKAIDKFTEQDEDQEEDENEVFEDTTLFTTPQEIIEEYQNTEHSLKRLRTGSLGLNHITDLYDKLIEEEKREAKKALTQLDEDNEEYFKYL